MNNKVIYNFPFSGRSFLERYHYVEEGRGITKSNECRQVCGTRGFFFFLSITEM